jgi:L,D-transpeptidase YcbB
VLRQYRQIEADGGWPQIPEGPKLEVGMESDRVVALRRRLLVTDDLAEGTAADSTAFDGALAEEVKGFQERHGLDADGVIGGKTLAALNVPVEARIGQIRVNLERARWVLHNLEPDYIIVNIAGFRVYVMENGEQVWTSRAVVGKPFRKTPVFKATMDHLVFNPTWTVPPTILRNDVLPKVRKDPSYLSQNNFSVIDGSGKRVDPSSVNWSAKNPPYRIVQGPGSKNALGEVKFMFPNKHAVYLHDTPSKSLFDKSERTFSSGCIRVQKPFELAELLLRGDSSWTAERMEKVRASGKTETVKLATPLPVLLLYWTVQPEADGTVRFMNDVYERDARILKELDEAFSTRI